MIRFKVIGRKNPQDKTQEKYYPQPIRNEKIGRKQIEYAMIDKTALSKAEARGVVVTLVDIIREELLRGNSVSLEGLGSFYVRTKSEGSDTPEEVTAHNIKNVLVGFRPAKELSDEVKKVSFQKED